MSSREAPRLPPPDRSMLLMSVRSAWLRWLFRTFWGESATHVGIYVGGKVFHITYSKGLRISNLENVLGANHLLDYAPLPAGITEQAISASAADLQRKTYNKPLFWYLFLRTLFKNWGIPTPELFRDPDRVMCADILSYTMDRALVSHEESPDYVFNRYREPVDGRERAAFAAKEVTYVAQSSGMRILGIDLVTAGFWAVVLYTFLMLGYVGPTIDAAAGTPAYMLKLQLAFDLSAIPAPPPPEYFRLIVFDLGYATLYGPALAALFHRYGRGLTRAVWAAPLVDMVLNWTETGLEITALADPTGPNAGMYFHLHSYVAIAKWIILAGYMVALAVLGAQMWKSRRAAIDPAMS